MTELGTGQPERSGDAAGHELDVVCRALTRLVRSFPQPPGEVTVRCGDIAIELRWRDDRAAAELGPSAEPLSLSNGTVSALVLEPTAPVASELEIAGSLPPVAHVIRAPLVGVFYHAPEPGAARYVCPGDLVEQGQQVGIVESMKLMNPIEAETAGRVVDVLVGNGEPVEYGQPLITLVLLSGSACATAFPRAHLEPS